MSTDIVFGGWGIPSNELQFPTLTPSRRPTHRPTPKPKNYVAIPSKMRTIDNIWSDDFQYQGGIDAGNGGWEILDELLQPAYDHYYMYDQSGTYQRVHGYWSGDYEPDQEPILMTQFFKCLNLSHVKIKYKFFACNADYNDFIRLYYNDKQIDFYRASQLRYSYYLSSCWRYDYRPSSPSSWFVMDRVNQSEPFKIQFEINPTFYDDELAVGDIQIQCEPIIPTSSPTTSSPTSSTLNPTAIPTIEPTTPSPTSFTVAPTIDPTLEPTISLSPTAEPTRSPSIDPTKSTAEPTLQPTLSPTDSTKYPSYSPINCPDYGHNYTNVDGHDDVLDAYNYIHYVTLGPNANSIVSTKNGHFIDQELNCTEPNGCDIHCDHPVSCLSATINCESDTGCNVYCNDGDSCDDVTINMNTKPGASITLICVGANSCKDLVLNTYEPSHAEVHCVESSSCENTVIYFDKVSVNKNPNTFIGCYAAHSCDGLTMYADGAYSQLRMYEFSDHITVINGYGYIQALETIKCGLESKYIIWDQTESIDTVVKKEFDALKLPCSGITIYCDVDNQTNVTVWNSPFSPYCNMEYHYKAIDVNGRDPKFTNAICVNVWLKEIVEWKCTNEGIITCPTGPTKHPTPSPTNYPSSDPTTEPSMIPTFNPTDAPTFSPTHNPSVSPTNAPIVSPTASPTKSPTIPPTFSPTRSPSQSPTESPTRYPTSNGNNFNRKMDIIYIFTNLTNKNYEFILNYSNNNAIEKIEEIIEQSYFDRHQLPMYKLFTVNINKLNGIDKEELTLNMLERENSFYVKSVVKFHRQYENYIVFTSANVKWQRFVTNTFQKYFNNSLLNFTAANISALALYQNESNDNNYIYWIVPLILLSCVMLFICISRCNRIYRTDGCLPVDSVNYFSLILFCLATYDVVTNIALIIDTFSENAHAGNEQFIATISGLIMLSFVVLKLILNLYYAITMEKLVSYNISAKNWYKKYKKSFIFCVLLSGGNCYPLLTVASSNLFGIKWTDSGISSLELKQLYYANNKILLTALLIECIPQLIAQFIYLFLINYITPNLLSAIVSSSILFLIYLIYFVINTCNKNKEKEKMNIFYYIEVKVNGMETSLKSKERKHIRNRKGLKLALKDEFVSIYGENSEINNNFEIGNVMIRRKGFIIRFIHRLNQKDLSESDLKTYCFDLFNSKKEEIIQIIFNHYHDLDLNKFDIKYHKEYPIEKRMSDYDVNIKHIETKSNTFNDDEERGESDDEESITDNNDEQQHLSQHRSEFRRAIKIIKQENKTKQSDYNHLMFVLQANNISYTVIDDVLNYATKAAILQKRDLSDIDNLDDSDNDNPVIQMQPINT